MSSTYFVTQEATKEILFRVTKVCGECYADLHEGETIHYDMQACRFLCSHCQEKLSLKKNETQENLYDEAKMNLFY